MADNSAYLAFVARTELWARSEQLYRRAEALLARLAGKADALLFPVRTQGKLPDAALIVSYDAAKAAERRCRNLVDRMDRRRRRLHAALYHYR